jgi:LuxR family maltose regulon positive regulatory protein
MATRQAERSPRVERRRRIVASKLSAPQRRPGIVDRTALVDALTQAITEPVVLVSAPAGYGKTTLLALWRERDERPFAWVSLDRTDNDPVAFGNAVLHGLEPVLGLDPELADALNVAEPPLEDLVLPALVDACAASTQAFVLVLDDLHLVTERRCFDAIGYLAERLPVGSQLALGTRSDPPLPLGSLRAHRRLAELRAAELALDEGEAQTLLAAAGVPLPDHLVRRLAERTEGWPAAMYLAALSLRDRADPEAFVEQFAGTTRHVADFLTEDVLARQSDDSIAFLLRTSVLGELTAPLCDALTEGADADRRLRELERSNLFVVPLDEERMAYRYHHLFGQYLRAELAHREPGLVPELHRRAWRWYREHDLVGRAVAHAHAAGDVDVAGELVAEAWSDTIRAGQIETVRGWIDAFDDEQVSRHAPLAIAAAWTAALTGQRERAAQFVEAARQGSWDGPMPDGTASLESAIAVTSSAFDSDGISHMRAVARRAVDLESAANPHRAVALEILGAALTLAGEFDRARVALAEAVELAGDASSPGAFSLSQLAAIELHEDNPDAALRYASRAHTVVQLPRMRANLANVATYSVVAELSRRRGDLEAAGVAVERANALLPRLTEGFWWLMIQTRILLAPVLVELGRVPEAVERLEEAGAVLAEHSDAGKLPDWHAEVTRRVRRSVRSPELSQAERRILRLLASELTLREIGNELYLSPNTVKTHTQSIYRKLGVCSRADAVRLARTQRRDSPG